ncbi:hypothetical protein KFL_009570010 [Klebsormidium nitens]|uniref:Uncharacterized protein n=1 Tax=Klebsormidium nitens TaxID=105231 RepID=A0A1Y1IVG2_KLENI|nr:hypothetical protein KFL_009570010 [Klebsormidium nitens]|eukprot:GAQ92248.1 hypothetical protein KFL_009570010 [Klebsormidium nitens]
MLLGSRLSGLVPRLRAAKRGVTCHPLSSVLVGSQLGSSRSSAGLVVPDCSGIIEPAFRWPGRAGPTPSDRSLGEADMARQESESIRGEFRGYSAEGFNQFQGYRLKGYIFYPDVRLMAEGSGESFNEPWPVFAKALSKHPLAKVDVIVEEKDDAETLTKALEPLVRRISTFDRTGSRPEWIDPAVEMSRMRKKLHRQRLDSGG